MAAPVTFLAGRAGSGKSRFIRQRVAELCARGETVALIVPEQFTFETERELAAALPGGLRRRRSFRLPRSRGAYCARQASGRCSFPARGAGWSSEKPRRRK